MQGAKLLAERLADKEIAAQMELSPKTVENHVRAILRNANVSNRTTFVLAFHSRIKP